MEKSRVPALNRCMAILHLLQEQPYQISEVVARTNLPRSTVYVVVEEMLKLGLIKQSRDGRLHLWMSLVDLGMSALGSFEYRALIAHHIEGLIKMLDCSSVHYGVIERGLGFYVIDKDTEVTKVRRSLEGKRVDLLRTAVGRCLLAFADEGSRQAFLLSNVQDDAQEPLALTEAVILSSKLQEARTEGYSVEVDDKGNLTAIAVPLFGHPNEFLGAIEVTFKQGQDKNKLNQYLEVLRGCSMNLNVLIQKEEGGEE